MVFFYDSLTGQVLSVKSYTDENKVLILFIYPDLQ